MLDIVQKARVKLDTTTYGVFLRAFNLNPKMAGTAIDLYYKDSYICITVRDFCKWVLAQP